MNARIILLLGMAECGAPPEDATATADTTTTTGASEGSESSTGEPISDGCGKPLPDNWFAPYMTTWGGQGNRATLVVNGDEREYIIEVPDPYDPNTPYPLVFAFHGNNSRMDNAYGQMLGREFEFQAFVAYPQGLPGEGIDAIWRLQAESIDVDLFDALVEDIGSRGCVDRRRVFTWGYSRGGYFANLLACVRGDVVAGSSSAAAGMPLETETCVGPVSQFIVRGTEDTVVPEIEPRLAKEAWLELDACSERPTDGYHPDCTVFEDCETDASVVYCESAGYGHVLHQDIPGMQEAAVAFLRSL